jgi:exosome complex RNA-binding protein Csl4
MDQRVVPGDILGTTLEFTSGEGTYVAHDQIRASITGLVSTSESENGKVINVYRGDQAPTIVPKRGDVVFCKVFPFIFFFLSLFHFFKFWW